MREIIDVLFWYSGFGMWSALVVISVLKIHFLLVKKEVEPYITIKNLIEFPFVMLWLCTWNEKKLKNSHKTINLLKKEGKFDNAYWLTKIGFNLVEKRYQKLKIKQDEETS